MNDPNPQPPRFSWLMAADRASTEQRRNGSSLRRYDGQVDTVMDDKMGDLLPIATVDTNGGSPPPAYTGVR